MNILSEELSSSLIGAVIGGGLALVGVVLGWALQWCLTWRTERNQVRAILQALGDETTVLESIYMSRVGAHVEVHGGQGPFEFYFPINSNYFVVYDSNAGGIGRVQSAELRKTVVETYARLKSLADTFGYNNRLLAEREQLDQQLAAAPDNVRLQALFSAKNSELSEYGMVIWELHREAMSAATYLRSQITTRLQGIWTP